LVWPGIAHHANHRRDIDDPAVPRLEHAAHECLAGQEHGGEVGVDHRLPFFLLHAHQQIVARDARIIDQNADRTFVGTDIRLDRADSRRLRSIQHQSPARDAMRLEPGRDRCSTFCGGRGTDHRRTGLPEQIGNGRADAARGAGNERPLTGK
jgi:hypothetical protein